MGYRNFRDVSNDWQEDAARGERRKLAKAQRKHARTNGQRRGFDDDDYQPDYSNDNDDD